MPDTHQPSRAVILIWGAGAMGGSIGAWLVDAGRKVVFVDQDRVHVDALNTRGLRITGPVANFQVPAAALLPADVTGHYETVLLCVKGQHTAAAMVALAPHVAEGGCVVSIQNGLNEPTIAEAVGAPRTVGAFVNFGADLMEPGVVMRGNRGTVMLGELDGRDSPRIRELHALLSLFEPKTRVTNNILGYLWSKLVYGALLFGTATTHLSIADALDAPDSRLFFVALGREVSAVARELGATLEAFDGFDPEAFRPQGSDHRALASLANLVAFNRGSAKTHSGIWRDLAVRKRGTEADPQLGAVIAAGEVHGVPTPLTRAVLAMIREIESGDREQAEVNLRELCGNSLPG